MIVADRFAGQVFAPTSYTRPLAPTFPSAGPRLRALLERHYRLNEAPNTGELVTLDAYQAALFDHLLERFPDDYPDPELAGRLRYRQWVVSMGRQNGKSLLASGFSVFGLLQHVPGPSVIGVATKVETANVIYGRVKYAIDNDVALSNRLRTTGTRGIRLRGGAGSYSVRPAAQDGVQSEPVSFGLVDELHMLRPIMWDSIVTGQRAKPDAMVGGITTAGDASSVLLKRLYDRGHAAIADPGADPRFGFFLWQAPDNATLDNDDHIKAANPAVACGRISLATVRSDCIGKPHDEVQRYTFNRFVDAMDPWVPLDGWREGHTPERPVTDSATVVYGIARTDGWEAATITASWQTEDGIWTEIVASITGATFDRLATLAKTLLAATPRARIAVEAATLSDLAKHLRRDSATVYALTATEMAQASSTLYSLIVRRGITHPGDALLTEQLPTVRRVGSAASGAWRIVAGNGPADAVTATLVSTYVAETHQPNTPQLF